MKWIKASEQFPKKVGRYIVKTIDNYKTAFEFDGLKFESGQWSQFDFEWLDETESPKVEGVEARDFVMKKFGLSKTLFLHNQFEDLCYSDLVEILTEYASIVSAEKDQRIEELEKENERLRGLVEKAFKAGHPHNWQGVHTSKQQWEKFKANNNL